MAASNDAKPTPADTSGAGVDPGLLEILVCPVDKGRLIAEDSHLRCSICGQMYPVEDGIPNMLVPSA